MQTFLRYFGAQLFAYAVDFGVFAAMFAATHHVVASNLVSKLISGVVAFYVLRTYTFKAGGDGRKQAIRYFALWLANLPATSLFISVFTWLVHVPFLAKILSDATAFILNYLISKHFIFHTAERAASAGERGKLDASG